MARVDNYEQRFGGIGRLYTPEGLARLRQAHVCVIGIGGDRMWEFLDRLLTVALPRIRDFRGLSDQQFDGHGNYTFGLSEQTMFYEIDVDKIDRPRGMDITVVTTATNNEEGRALLRELGFPFKRNEAK